MVVWQESRAAVGRQGLLDRPPLLLCELLRLPGLWGRLWRLREVGNRRTGVRGDRAWGVIGRGGNRGTGG